MPDDPTPDSQPTPDPAPPSPVQSWRDGFTDADLRANPTLQRFESLDDFGRSHLELRSSLGSRDKVTIPGEDAQPEEWDAVFNKLGRPETVEGYELQSWTPPEEVPWNPDVTSKMLGKMHARRLTKDQAQGLLQDYAEVLGEQWSGHTQEIQTNAENLRKALQQEYGAAYAVKMKRAKEAGLALAEKAGLEGNPFEMELPNGMLLGDVPEMIKLLVALGEEFKEDEGFGVPTRRFTRTPEEAKREHDKLIGDPSNLKILMDVAHPEHKALLARKTELEREMFHVA